MKLLAGFSGGVTLSSLIEFNKEIIIIINNLFYLTKFYLRTHSEMKAFKSAQSHMNDISIA